MRTRRVVRSAVRSTGARGAGWKLWRWLVGGALLLVLAAATAAPAASAAATPVRPNVFVYYLDDLRDAFPGGCQHGLRVIEPLPATCGARSFGRRLPGHLQRVVEADRLLHESSDERPCRGAPRR